MNKRRIVAALAEQHPQHSKELLSEVVEVFLMS